MTDALDPGRFIRSDFARVSDALVRLARDLPTATLHEAGGRIGALPSAIKPIGRAMKVCGPAMPVQSPGGDNLWLHRAIYSAHPGDVLVAQMSDLHEYGYWGEIMSTAAKARGLGGLVIEGGVRDGGLLEEIAFPVFATTLCIRGSGKDFGARGFIGYPVLLGDIRVQPGDLVVGDGDGVVVIPRERAETIVAAAQEREAAEAMILERLAAGETTLDIYNLRRQ